MYTSSKILKEQLCHLADYLDVFQNNSNPSQGGTTCRTQSDRSIHINHRMQAACQVQI